MRINITVIINNKEKTRLEFIVNWILITKESIAFCDIKQGEFHYNAKDVLSIYATID